MLTVPCAHRIASMRPNVPLATSVGALSYGIA
jgi:hypothetical protein